MKRGWLPRGGHFSGGVLSARGSFDYASHSVGFIRRFAPHFAQDDRHGWELCTGVSGIYAWQGYYKRRLTITTNATVILRERMRTHVSSREPKELRVLGTNPLKAFLFEGSTQCHKILRLHLSPRLNCIGAPHFAQDDRLWQESGTGVSGNYA